MPSNFVELLEELVREVEPPQQLAHIWWDWDPDERFEQLDVTFTIHTEPVDHPGRDLGYLFMVVHGKIARSLFHVSVDVVATSGGDAVKRVWLGTSRVDRPRDGPLDYPGRDREYGQTGILYDWGPGDYTVRVAPDSTAARENPFYSDRPGKWYGVWITDMSTIVTERVGAFWVPLRGGEAKIEGPLYSMLEIYGWRPFRLLAIPEWHISIGRPAGDRVPARRGTAGYPWGGLWIPNADVSYDRNKDVVDMRAGWLTPRTTGAWDIWFDE